MRLAKDPEVYKVLKFLREREIVHFQRFGEALEFVRADLNKKNYYAYNPAFDKWKHESIWLVLHIQLWLERNRSIQFIHNYSVKTLFNDSLR